MRDLDTTVIDLDANGENATEFASKAIPLITKYLSAEMMN